MQAVIFDFGRVICDFDIGKFIAKASKASSLSPAKLQAAIAGGMATAERYETGLMTTKEFYDEVCRTASLTMTEAAFAAAYTDIFTPIPATFALVKSLKRRYKLGLLSNTNALHYEFGIKPVEIFPLFDAVTLSHEVRAMKPDPRIYEDALAKLALPAGECAYIDDIAGFVAAGRSLGLHAIQYTTHEKLLNDLTSAGVMIDPA